MSRPPSPCVKICQLEGNICIGCWRSLAEIGAWPRAGNAQRAAIRNAAEGRRQTMALTANTEAPA